MNVQCQKIDELLLAGDRQSMEAAGRHAAACPECLEKLREWNEISETAASLRTSWRSDLLWPRIERALRAGAGPLRAEGRGPRAAWRVAAAIVLTAGIAATSWYVVRQGSREATYDQQILRITAVDEAERAEQQHLSAIERLEKLAEPKLDEADAPVMISYREKLMLLDDAIAECQANIERNRQNAHVRKQLLAVYSEKQKTLQDVLREGSDVTNE